MNTRLTRILTTSIILSGLILAQGAIAAPPQGMDGFQLSQQPANAGGPAMAPLRESPQEAAMGGLERLGILIPLFDYCHTPVSVKEPFLKLEALMEKTAIQHKIASASEVKSWVNLGESKTRTQWTMAKEKGYNVAGSCIAIEMELQRQDPAVKNALRKLKSLSQQNLQTK